MKDLFERILENKGPLGKWASVAEGYFVFPKLEGPISNRMKFNGKEVITWSVNDYLGLANQPEIREVDAAAAKNKDMEKRRLHPFEALTKTLKWRMELKNGGAPLVADEIGCGTDDLLQVEGGASERRWVLLKIPRCDIDGLGEEQ